MFANPIWSALILCAPLAVYWFIIRPRLRARFIDLYSHLDSFWARVWARLYAFRTLWVATAGALATAAPDLLVLIAPVDFSPFLPQPWPAYTGPATSAVILIMKAFETKPGSEKA